MITISGAQFDSMKSDAERRFIDRVTARLTVHFPEHAARLGAERTRAAAVATLTRGREYGLESEYHLFLFSCLSFAFGFRFDSDPALPWAGGTLRSRLLGSPAERVERVYDLSLAATSGSGQPWVSLPPEAR